MSYILAVASSINNKISERNFFLNSKTSSFVKKVPVGLLGFAINTNFVLSLIQSKIVFILVYSYFFSKNDIGSINFRINFVH